MITPSAAPMERMFITDAVSGTRRLRKTVASNKNASTMITAMKSGSFSARTFEKSIPAAVWPPTWMASDDPAVALGTSARIWFTRVVVCAACGL